MARKARDYAAEQRRRNELARARGFTSRSQQRRRIESGKFPAIQPQRIRSPRVVEAQARLREQRAAAEAQSPKRVGGQRSKLALAEENAQWGAAHAGQQIARFDWNNALPGVTFEEYTRAYHAAFVAGRGQYRLVRRRGGSKALRHYFVDVTGYYTADEYESRYGLVRKR